MVVIVVAVGMPGICWRCSFTNEVVSTGPKVFAVTSTMLLLLDCIALASVAAVAVVDIVIVGVAFDLCTFGIVACVVVAASAMPQVGGIDSTDLSSFPSSRPHWLLKGR